MADCQWSVVDGRSKKCWGNYISCQSASANRQWAIDNRQSATGAKAVYIIRMVSMRKAAGRKTGWTSFGMSHRAGRHSQSATRRPGATSAPKVGKTAQAPPSGGERAAFRLDRARALLIAALVACATLPYLNILVNGFVYDDDSQLVLNPYVRSFGYLKEIFTTNVWSFRGVTSVTNYYRPMMMLGYLACYKLFGLRPYGFHVFSLLLHVLVVCLVFALTERVTGDRVWAFVAGALFALHPIHSESVAWIAAVTDLEVTFFYLLTFGLFLALARPGGGRSEGMVAALGGTFLLALLSKEQAMTLPALATVYEHFYRADRSETSLSQKLARYGVLWLVGLVYVLFRIHLFGVLAPAKDFPELNLEQILLCAIALVGQYVWKLLWPVRLCAFYVFHPSKSLFDARVLAGLLVLLAFAALFLLCWRSRDRNVRFVSFAILWFFATLAPVLDAHFVGVNVFTERYLYLPSVGVAWLVGLGASKLWSRAGRQPAARRALLLAGLAVGGLFTARIVTRNRDWNNDIVLYTRTLDFSPDAYQIQNNLGTIYWHAHAVDKAESVWQQALARNPKNPDVLNNLGLLAIEGRHYAEAAEYFQRAIKLKANLPDPHLNLGDAYMKMGRTDLAEPQLRAAVRLSPLNTRAHDKLGELLADTGRLDEAEDQFRASISIEPSTLAYNYLGMLDIRRRAGEAAERDFLSALSLDGSDSDAHFGLGYVYKAAGRKAEALRQYRAGLAGDPSNAQALAAVRSLQQQSPGTAP
jgi:tetratricopeptide (TPR) repeat protein